MDFAHVDTWIFDLDNTLYPPEMALFPQIESRMTDYVMRTLAVERDAADQMRRDWWMRHGTTLAGLMAEHAIDPVAYLDEVHDIDFAALTPEPALAQAIRALPGLKIIHTNADAAYAGRVLARRELDVFDAVHGIGEVGYHPKPDPRSFAAVLRAHGLNPARCAMFEDDPRNLEVPFSLGMRTILVGAGRHGPDELPEDHSHAGHVLWHTRDILTFVTALAGAVADVRSSQATLSTAEADHEPH